MDIRVTIVRGSTGAEGDAHLVAADTEPAAALLDALRELVAARPDEAVHVAGRVLDAQASVRGCELEDGQRVTVGPPIPSRPRTDAAVGHPVLAVVSGPAAGTRLMLTEPRATVGRDAECDLQLADVAVSRCHLAVTVAPDGGGLAIEDLGSHNGTSIDGQPIAPGRPARLDVGARIRMGGSELVVRRRQPAARMVPTSDGRLQVHRSARARYEPGPVEIRLPQPPTPTPPTRLPVLAAAAPLALGMLLAVLLRQWQFLAFTVLSPVMIAGQAISDRTASRRADRAALAGYHRDHATAQEAVASALVAEQRRRRVAAPDLAALVAAATDRTVDLWQRGADDTDTMTLRLGRGEPPSQVTVVGGPAPCATDVPVCVPLLELGAIGIEGTHLAATALARSLLLQAATLHGPSQLRVVVLAPGGVEEWSWAGWLPHTLPTGGEPCTALIATDEQQAASRLAELAGPTSAPMTLLMVDARFAPGARPLDGAIAAVAGRGAAIWLATDPAALPVGCRAVVHVRDGPGATCTVSGPGAAAIDLRPDLTTRPVADATARALAPLRDDPGTGPATLARTVPWPEVVRLAFEDPDQAAAGVARAWLAGPSTAVPLGRGRDGDVVIDLARDGPHALVAGTTGSGKSELLRTLVAGLAAANRPEDLSLLLVDFKGGAAFDSCARLPHTVGVVTDLDRSSTARAIASLQAELRRRERALADVGTVDLDGYVAARQSVSGPPGLSRLVIVVDEFATLGEELPEFLGGLVGIAQRGRSLGVHLVLATQRPAGIVSAEIKANTRLRICLAVTDEADSRDVIDGPQAAALTPGTPGRAYLRAGPGAVTLVQTALVSRRGGGSSRRVTLSPAGQLGRPPPVEPDATGTRTDLERFVDAAIEAAGRLGCSRPPAPWLPPLPDRLGLADLAGSPSEPVWGLVDLPDDRRQEPLGLEVAEGGTVLVAGTARSGRSTALRAMALAAAAALPPERLHLWAVDTASDLASLDALPHCGGVVPASDTERLWRLMSRIVKDATQRRVDGWAGQPLLMLLIDGWEQVLAQLAAAEGDRFAESMMQLAADAPAAGLRLAISAGRGALTGRLGAAAADRFTLRLPDRSDYSLIGLTARDVPDRMPPGRAIRAADLKAVQVAVPDQRTVDRAQGWPQTGPPSVRRVDRLPEIVRLDEAAATDGRGGRVLALGLRADDLAPALHDITDGGALLVAGPPRSGRSTALTLLAEQLAATAVAVVSPRRSPLSAAGATVRLPVDDQDHALALLDALVGPDGGAPTVLVDDADLLPDGPLADRLCELARSARDGRNLLVLAGPPDAFAAAFRGPVAEVRRGRTGILLRPGNPHEGELLGVRLPRRDARHDPPGRGWWASGGEATAIQVAMPRGISRSPLPGAAPAPPGPAPPNGPCCVPPASRRTAPGRRH